MQQCASELTVSYIGAKSSLSPESMSVDKEAYVIWLTNHTLKYNAMAFHKFNPDTLGT